MPKILLNPAFEGAVGQFNGYVVGDGRSGLVLRRKPSYRRPSSPAQKEVAERMRLASAVWSAMSPEQAQAWRDYGEAIVRRRSLDGRPYHMTGQTSFIALATKFLQVDPGGDVPLAPPTGEFLGDELLVAASVSQPSSIGFTATGPNTPGTLTELLVQRLASRLRKPGKRYTTAAFVSYQAGGQTFAVPTEPGPYACAFRFVEKATGRATLATPIGVVEVA